MKERSIRFTGDEVRAILDGRKTQTRRPCNVPPETLDVFFDDECDSWCYSGCKRGMDDPEAKMIRSPFGAVGDRLWVRETHKFNTTLAGYRVTYKADDSFFITDPECEGRIFDDNYWRPSIHMPRWASRITLEITAVRVERVQDISEEDAKAEGMESGIWDRDACLLAGATDADDEELVSFRNGFGFLWQSIYGNWDANPWVWVYEFKRLTNPRPHA